MDANGVPSAGWFNSIAAYLAAGPTLYLNITTGSYSEVFQITNVYPSTGYTEIVGTVISQSGSISNGDRA